MRTAQAVEAFLDEQRLSELLGRPARSLRLRIKPGVSLSAAIAGERGPDGWARLLWPQARPKGAKAEHRAARRGLRVARRELPGGALLQHGGVRSDPALRAVLERAWPEAEGSVLSYNPLRRLVLRCGGRVLRVQARPLAPAGLHAVLAGGPRVPERLDDGRDERVSVLRLVGDTDLARCPRPDAVRAAGMQLAALHALGGRLPERLAAALAGRAPDALAQGTAHARLLDALAPPLAARLRRIAVRVPAPPAGPQAICHGDAAPGQVLLERRSGEVWLTDFDRACLMRPVEDLGSYLAAAGPGAAAPLLDGYRAAAGAARIERRALRAAEARSRLARLLEPLRLARPDWRGAVETRLRRLEAVLA